MFRSVGPKYGYKSVNFNKLSENELLFKINRLQEKIKQTEKIVSNILRDMENTNNSDNIADVEKGESSIDKSKKHYELKNQTNEYKYALRKLEKRKKALSKKGYPICIL